MQTYQIHRGAGLGFLLQALVPLLETAALFAASLGLDWVLGSPYNAWVSTVISLPLLAFAFHWLNGDHSTANVLLGGVLLLAASSDYLTEEGKDVAAHSVLMVASVTILIVSIFTGNAYGIAGSLLAGIAGLLAATRLLRLLMLRKRDVLRCLMAAANLSWRWALQLQHQVLEWGSAGLLAETAD
uniref:transmembrane protein 276 n=1 Tax=Euleptes europaea TaxID=460621 RepID=UPI00254088A3|nr:transmembrane protein 276 [Euleptes europaea]